MVKGSNPLEASLNQTAVGVAFVHQSADYLLNDYLPKIQRCLEQLTDEQIWWRPNSQANSIGNLVLHLSGNARQWIVCGLGDQPDHRNRSLEFEQSEIIPRTQLLERLTGTLREVAEVLTKLPVEVLLERREIQGREVEVLEAIFHVTEHFAMHTGQIIMLTKILAQKDLGFYDFSTGKPFHH